METIQQPTEMASSIAQRILENSVLKGNSSSSSHVDPFVPVCDGNAREARLHRAPIVLTLLLTTFLTIGPVLQRIDPAAGILDIGILSVLLLGIIGGLAAILLCLWLQELLWQPFQSFRKEFRTHFNDLTSWQQCILYFSVFFLLLYALLWGLAMLL